VSEQPTGPAPDPGQLGLVFHRFRGLGQRMEALAERLDQLEQRGNAGPEAGGGQQAAEAGLPEWTWVGLDPAERAERLWELHQWATWLVDTYEVPTGQLLHCWYRHGSMTADLVALQAGWNAAYLNPEAEPDRPSRWHDTLERTLRRIREWDRHGCGRSGSHTEQVDTAADAADYPDTQMFDQYMRQMVSDLSHSAATVPRTP